MTKEKIKKQIENGSSFSVDGRPVKIFQDRLVIEINMGRGKAYANLSNEDFANLKHQSMKHGGPRKGAGRPKGSGTGRKGKVSSINLLPELWSKIDEARGNESRSKWISKQIESILP